MDRRHRPLLSWLAGGALLLPTEANLSAQPAATPAPAASATPWVQASPPPGMTPTPAPKPTPKPSVAPTVAPSQEEVTREMMRRREAEQHVQDAKPEKKEARPEPSVRLDQLPPDERAAYQRNLPLWRQLPEEERDALRKRADERARQELDHAYQETGLNLDHDQREVFDLRYKQERRRLEHDLQEKANAERQRWLVEITARLKQEFAVKPMPGASATPSATPVPKKATTMTNVAWFAPHKLGDAGWTKLQAVLDANHITYTTTEFAATYLGVSSDQRDLVKGLIRELIDKDKLPIHLSDEVEPMGIP